jgi:hypothetical protein
VYKHKFAYTVNVFSTPSGGDVYQTQPAEGFLFKYNQRNALNLTGKRAGTSLFEWRDIPYRNRTSPLFGG